MALSCAYNISLRNFNPDGSADAIAAVCLEEASEPFLPDVRSPVLEQGDAVNSGICQREPFRSCIECPLAIDHHQSTTRYTMRPM